MEGESEEELGRPTLLRVKRNVGAKAPRQRVEIAAGLRHLHLAPDPRNRTRQGTAAAAGQRDVDGASGYHAYDSFHVGGDPNDPGVKDRVPQFAFFDTGTFHNGD